MPERIPDEHLDMMVICPVGEGEGEGPMPLGKAIALEGIGPKILAMAAQNIANAQELIDTGVDPEKAMLMTFGGAIEKDEAGQILRSPDWEPQAAEQAEPQLAGAEKK